jgi:hypothetical protein
MNACDIAVVAASDRGCTTLLLLLLLKLAVTAEEACCSCIANLASGSATGTKAPEKRVDDREAPAAHIQRDSSHLPMFKWLRQKRQSGVVKAALLLWLLLFISLLQLLQDGNFCLAGSSKGRVESCRKQQQQQRLSF